MQTVRTPDDRFENLKDFPYAPHYVEIDAGDGTPLRIHYVDEGQGELMLALHGQPSWSYLYRKMIPVWVAAGYRVIAPDLVGFGRSDKPVDRASYSYAAHVAWLNAFMEALEIRDATLFCQDWGSLIGLRSLTDQPERFDRVVLSNGALPVADGVPEELAPRVRQMLAEVPVLAAPEMVLKLVGPQEDRLGFMYWLRHCDGHPDFQPAEIMKLVLQHCDDGEYRAWAAPFPSEEFMAGARQFPSLVPILPDDPAIPANRAAWEVLANFDKPFLTIFADGDPLTRGREQRFIDEVPGAKGQAHQILEGAGHFIQDDAGEVLAAQVVDFMRANA